MQSISNMALDAQIVDRADMAERAAVIQELTHCNPEKGTSIQAGFYGKGMSLNGGRTEAARKNIFLASDHNEAQQMADHMMGGMAYDDTVQYGIPSNGVPAPFTTVFTTLTVKQVFQTTPFREFTQDFQQGAFGTTYIMIPTIQGQGVSQLYSDYAPTGQTTINVNWMEREVVYLERTITYGDRATAQMEMGKIDLVSQMREMNATLINLDWNNIGFSGYVGLRCFGLLNDPSLNPLVPCPDSAANPSSSQWFYKTYLEIAADVRNLFGSIIALAGGQVDFNAKCKLGVPPAVYTFLLNQNALGDQTVMMYLKGVFPNMDIVQVQNYQGTALSDEPIGSDVPNTIQLILSSFAGQQVALNAFTTPYNSHGVQRLISSFTEKVSFGLAGAFVTQAQGIATMQGV